MKKERAHSLGKADEAKAEAKNAKAKAEKEKMRADNAEQMLGEARKALEESNKRISVLSKKVKTIDDLKEVADAADKAALDAKQVVELINRRVFQRNSDATRLLVRSRETPDDPLKYTIEYVQAALSLEKKLCVMLYDEGTRDHMLQEEKIFKDSSIVGFVADRAPYYPAIVKDLEGQELLRQACWFHARHYLVDAYLVDSRMEMLKKMRAAGDKYGQMVHRAVDYILDDEDAFRTFLSDGRIDMHNIAVERCF